MLTPAEIDLLRRLPEKLGAQPSAAGDPLVRRRGRLQAAGMLSVRWDAGEGCFLAMITDRGVAALKAAS